MHAQELINNTRLQKWTTFKINEIAAQGADIEVKAPPCFVEDHPEITEVSDLRVKIIKRATQSHLPHDHGYGMLESSIVEFSIMNAHAEEIKLELGD